MNPVRAGITFLARLSADFLAPLVSIPSQLRRPHGSCQQG